MLSRSRSNQSCMSSRSGLLFSWRTARRSSALPAGWGARSRTAHRGGGPPPGRTASSEIGETGVPLMPSRAFFSISASSRKPRCACAKQNAGVPRQHLLLQVEQRVEAVVAIGLQDAGEAGQMLLGMLASSIARGVIDRCRRRRAGKGSVGHPAHKSRSFPSCALRLAKNSQWLTQAALS